MIFGVLDGEYLEIKGFGRDWFGEGCLLLGDLGIGYYWFRELGEYGRRGR